MTTPHVLHWDILSRDFDVGRVEMILRHNVQYRGSLSGLPILVLECSKQDSEAPSEADLIRLRSSERRQPRSSSAVAREGRPDRTQ